MIGWQINEKGDITKINGVEMLDDVDSVKVKITATLITEEDIALFSGEGKAATLPLIPGRMAVGQISELGSDSAYLQRGVKVYISPIYECGECYHCINGKPEECYDFRIAGLNGDGFLRDFAVVKMKDVHPLPANVKEKDAIYLDYVSLALSVIDKLEIEKGQHVAIFGSSVFASILAQLIIYYQGVPVVIGDNDEELLLARKSGVYYTIKVSPRTEKEVSAITGGRMAGKIVYLTRSGISVDLATKIAAPSAKIAFAGFSYPNVKVPLNVALRKQLTCLCVTNGYGNEEPAINILANKAIDLANYSLPATKMDDIEANIRSMQDDFKNKRPVKNLLVNMLG